MDCLCPHIEFHGTGILVLSSRTRAQARFTGEKGRVKEMKRSRRKKKLTETYIGPCTVKTKQVELPERQSKRIVGRYGNHQGKKPKVQQTSNQSICFESSDSSYSSSSGPSETRLLSCSSAIQSSGEQSEIVDAEVIRCSTPLHLPSPLEFSFVEQSADSNSNEESSSGDDFFLFDGSSMTVESFRNKVIDFTVRHKLADNALKELLKLIRVLLPTPNNVPKSLNHRRAKITAEGFEVLDARKQISRVVDRNHDALIGEETLTLFWNTDGASPFRSAKMSFWPFWAFIDNIPNPRRTALENMILIALWKGELS